MTAARYLVVDAVNNPKVIRFYEDNGFVMLFESDQQELEYLHGGRNADEIAVCRTRLMFFDLIVLKQ